MERAATASRFNREYFGELAQNARPLASASLGVGVSLPLFAYTNSVFAPHLIEQFGWSRSDFALISLTMLTTLLILPFAGRFTDRLGVRPVALLGTILVPLCYVAYAFQNGNILTYVAIFTVVLAVGSLTSPLVYSRLVAQNFDRAQGLGLTIMNCGPALIAVPLIPTLNWCIERYGWRVAYLGMAAMIFVIGMVAVWLAGPGKAEREIASSSLPDTSANARQDYRTIFHSPVFWVIVIALYLCQIQTQLHSSQMNLMIIEQGLTKQTAAEVASVYASGTIIGRILCGLALDRLSTRWVTAVSMGIPALGFLLLASSMDGLPVITLALLLIGVSVGAETDLVCFLVARYFKLRVYGTTLGVIHCFSFLASASGGFAVSQVLARYDSFTLILWFVAGAITVGACLFLLLPKEGKFEKIG